MPVAINFHPTFGALLYCDFSGFKPPEMVKSRPVFVLSRRHHSLCTVVPLSGTEPTPMQPYHHLMDPKSLPEKLSRKGDWWAKCDCITTVAYSRLDRIKIGRDPNTGKRIYVENRIGGKDLRAIQKGVLHVLCLSDLIWPES